MRLIRPSGSAGHAGETAYLELTFHLETTKWGLITPLTLSLGSNAKLGFDSAAAQPGCTIFLIPMGTRSVLKKTQGKLLRSS